MSRSKNVMCIPHNRKLVGTVVGLALANANHNEHNEVFESTLTKIVLLINTGSVLRRCSLFCGRLGFVSDCTYSLRDAVLIIRIM